MQGLSRFLEVTTAPQGRKDTESMEENDISADYKDVGWRDDKDDIDSMAETITD
jgi:hypothetical protein